jgi:hypothetical protein
MIDVILFKRCLSAAEELRRDPYQIRKANYPSRDQFDEALVALSELLDVDGTLPFHKAYVNALESPDGQTLYWGRERAAIPEPIQKRSVAEPLTRAEKAIEAVVKKHMDDTGEIYEKAMCHVLETRTDLYEAYLQECADQEFGR